MAESTGGSGSERPEPGSDELFRAVFSAAPVAIATIAPDATLLHVNRAGCELVGYRENELVGVDFSLIVAPPSVAAASDAFIQLVEGEVASVQLDLTLQRKDGTTLVAEVFGAAVPSTGGRPPYLVALAQDVTERRRTERRIFHQAMNDGLTELPNRAWFATRLEQASARLERRPGTLLAVFFIDLDGFKAVNDRFGHTVGDEALFVAAGRIRATVRPSDSVARHGGDEFTVLCEDLATEADAAEIADRLSGAFARPCRLSSGTADIRVSIGVALTARNLAPGQLIAMADEAMYEAKSSGAPVYRTAEPPPGR